MEHVSRYDTCECGRAKRSCAKRCQTCYIEGKQAAVPPGTNYERFGRDQCPRCHGPKSKRAKTCTQCQFKPAYRNELKWVGADLDATLCEPVWTPQNPTDAIGPPIVANVKKLEAARTAGYRVHIYTARPSYQYEIIERWLIRNSVPFDGIHTGKLLVRTLVDDRSTHPNAPDWTAPSDPEAAWAAGFFDGEGCIYAHKRDSRRISPSLSIAQTDPRPLERFKLALGIAKEVTGPYKPKTENSKPYWHLTVTGRADVIEVLHRLWPFMSEPKQEQCHRVWRGIETSYTDRSPRLDPLPEVGKPWPLNGG